MGDAILHQRADDSGAWCDYDAQVALVHRRLSILICPRPVTSLVSASGRFVIVFNGEIYNHLELRKAAVFSGNDSLGGILWRGHSDTETLLASIEAWGLEETLSGL